MLKFTCFCIEFFFIKRPNGLFVALTEYSTHKFYKSAHLPLSAASKTIREEFSFVAKRFKSS
ncbi:hypothetical protein MGSAQ_001299 [marine sediment metagenome]|uniref:Uncharacterized protein n=1 Tax=marine sediment metagenome TaxID=412755 RepID=A0A1B6NUR9_9ZZZZ